jgi:hypothetical protein
VKSLAKHRLAAWGALLASSLGACGRVDHEVGSAAGGHTTGGAGGATTGGVATGGATTGGATTGGATTGGATTGGATTGGATTGAAATGGAVIGGFGNGETSGNGAGGRGGTAGGVTGGSGGTVAGSGTTGGLGGLPECRDTVSPVATGCITDALGSFQARDLGLTSPTTLTVTVTALDRGDPLPAFTGLDPNISRELVLRTADDRELRYFLALPGLPDDFVKVGDELELFVDAHPNILSVLAQTLVLSQNSELVVFTVNTFYFGNTETPDLSAYGLDVANGEPYCGTPNPCGSNTVAQTSELVVKQGTDEQHLRAGDTRQMMGMSISVQELRDTVGAAACDPPPGFHRYGGFGTPR